MSKNELSAWKRAEIVPKGNAPSSQSVFCILHSAFCILSSAFCLLPCFGTLEFMTDSDLMSRPLSVVDPEVYDAIQHEVERQHGRLELIASENFTSEAVLQATGSVFTNKYAEGYPGKRYYGGCEFTDIVENLARDRAKKLFGAEHANVQPHSGSQANQAAYAAVLQPGDTILGMNLAHGGHLTHGHKLNFSGKTYKIVPYGVTKET